MKFLHTADLHIGKSLNNFSMIEEQKHAFEQIFNYIKIKKPDIILIAGDIYDKSLPSVESVKILDDFLTELASFNLKIIICAGNHDSQERLSFASRLLESKNIFFNGKIELFDEFGAINFYVLPFIRAGISKDINQVFAEAINAFDIDYSQRNIIIAHQFFAGEETQILNETENNFDENNSANNLSNLNKLKNSVGGLDCVNFKLLEKFDYAALGHLHGANKLGENFDYIRYSGSPVKYSFSEINQEKSVVFGEIREKNNLSLNLLKLEPIHEMREIRGSLNEILSLANSLDENLSNNQDYIKIILSDTNEIIDPMSKIRAIYPNAMSIEFENSRIINLQENAKIKNLQEVTTEDLFKEFFLESQGINLSEEQEKIIREIMLLENY